MNLCTWGCELEMGRESLIYMNTSLWDTEGGQAGGEGKKDIWETRNGAEKEMAESGKEEKDWDIQPFLLAQSMSHLAKQTWTLTLLKCLTFPRLKWDGSPLRQNNAINVNLILSSCLFF